MRFIRLLGALVIFYGLSYLLHALMQIVSLIPTSAWRISHVGLIAINLTIGIVTIINGIGLLLSQRWARISWLVTVTALLLFHNLVLLLTYWWGSPSLIQQVFNVLLIFFLAVISWTKLPDSSVEKAFR